MIKYIISILMLIPLLSFSQQSLAQLGNGKTKAEFKKIAIVVYAQNKKSKRFIRTARSRLENILMDNGIAVLDKNKADKLKTGWDLLNDPGHFVTAEEFVENAGKFEIDGILRVYLTVDSANTLGNFYNATAQVDIRFVDNEAKVESFTTSPMGSPGNPPSDGLTPAAALVNAVQRAIDKATAKIGFDVIDVANPRLLTYELVGPFEIVAPNKSLLKRKTDTINDAINYAELKNGDWIKETVTCNATAPGNNFAAVGGYVFKKTYGRFKYWSNLHLINLQAKKETLVFGPLVKATSKKGTSKIVDCMFLYNWRFLAALTEHHLFVWDTERNMLLSSSELPQHIDDATLDYFKQGKDDYIVILNGTNKNIAFKVGRKK